MSKKNEQVNKTPRVSCFMADCDRCESSKCCTKRKGEEKVYARDCNEFRCAIPQNSVLCENCGRGRS